MEKKKFSKIMQSDYLVAKIKEILKWSLKFKNKIKANKIKKFNHVNFLTTISEIKLTGPSLTKKIIKIKLYGPRTNVTDDFF
jgi:hypothetical protein